MGKNSKKTVAKNQASFVAATTPAPVTPTPVSRTTYGLTIKAIKDIPEGTKIATQARVVYNAIKSAGANGITETQLPAALVKAGLVTRQSPLRIFRFYRKLLVTNGYIVTA